MNDPEMNSPGQLVPPNNIYPQLMNNRGFLLQYVIPYYWKTKEYVDSVFI